MNRLLMFERGVHPKGINELLAEVLRMLVTLALIKAHTFFMA
jgi:hypothetical protein